MRGKRGGCGYSGGGLEDGEGAEGEWKGEIGLGSLQEVGSSGEESRGVQGGFGVFGPP